jgi:hypothetical protein
MSETSRDSGKHVRSLHRARRLTQEVLAERSKLSADTIRRLERGRSRRVWLRSTSFVWGSSCGEQFVRVVRDRGAGWGRELADLVLGRTPREIVLATRVLRALFD